METGFFFTDENGNEMRVAEYIIGEIRNDELEFENLIYNSLFEAADEIVLKGHSLDKQLFINNPNSDIARVSAELMTTKYNLDTYWEKRGTYVEKRRRQAGNTSPQHYHSVQNEKFWKKHLPTKCWILSSRKKNTLKQKAYSNFSLK